MKGLVYDKVVTGLKAYIIQLLFFAIGMGVMGIFSETQDKFYNVYIYWIFIFGMILMFQLVSATRESITAEMALPVSPREIQLSHLVASVVVILLTLLSAAIGLVFISQAKSFSLVEVSTIQPLHYLILSCSPIALTASVIRPSEEDVDPGFVVGVVEIILLCIFWDEINLVSIGKIGLGYIAIPYLLLVARIIYTYVTDPFVLRKKFK